MNEGRENLAWLDLLRVAAALAVVVVHVSAAPVVYLPDLTSLERHAANLLDSLSRWCIGVFIMVSGALLLDPERRESVPGFFRKRVRRILVPILFWSAAYFALTLALGRPLTPTKALQLLWEGRPWYHMWYLFMVIGLYAVTPILRSYVARSGTELRWGVTILALVLTSLWDLRLAIDEEHLPATVATMFVPYLGYYMLGYELRRLAPIAVSSDLLWLGFGVGAIATIVGSQQLMSAYGASRPGLYMYEYLSPNVILMSAALFCLASRTGSGLGHGGGRGAFIARWVAGVAPLTLGIYLWHPMLIVAFRKLGLTAIGFENGLGVVLVVVPVFALSLLLTWLMSRIPILRAAVGL